jgi:hypothetical protein
MLLIILLGLIAKLALVSSDCNDGTGYVTNFDFPKVRIAWGNKWFVVPLTKHQ